MWIPNCFACNWSVHTLFWTVGGMGSKNTAFFEKLILTSRQHWSWLVSDINFDCTRHCLLETLYRRKRKVVCALRILHRYVYLRKFVFLEQGSNSIWRLGYSIDSCVTQLIVEWLLYMNFIIWKDSPTFYHVFSFHCYFPAFHAPSLIECFLFLLRSVLVLVRVR